MNDLRGLFFLMLLGLPMIAAVKLECRTHFICINATHFHICGDFGDGKLKPIESIIFSCPPRLVCDETSINECHYPVITTTTTLTTISDFYEENSTSELPNIISEPSTEISAYVNNTADVINPSSDTLYIKKTTAPTNVFDNFETTTMTISKESLGIKKKILSSPNMTIQELTQITATYNVSESIFAVDNHTSIIKGDNVTNVNSNFSVKTTNDDTNNLTNMHSIKNITVPSPVKSKTSASLHSTMSTLQILENASVNSLNVMDVITTEQVIYNDISSTLSAPNTTNNSTKLINPFYTTTSDKIITATPKAVSILTLKAINTTISTEDSTSVVDTTDTNLTVKNKYSENQTTIIITEAPSSTSIFYNEINTQEVTTEDIVNHTTLSNETNDSEIKANLGIVKYYTESYPEETTVSTKPYDVESAAYVSTDSAFLFTDNSSPTLPEVTVYEKNSNNTSKISDVITTAASFDTDKFNTKTFPDLLTHVKLNDNVSTKKDSTDNVSLFMRKSTKTTVSIDTANFRDSFGTVSDTEAILFTNKSNSIAVLNVTTESAMLQNTVNNTEVNTPEVRLSEINSTSALPNVTIDPATLYKSVNVTKASTTEANLFINKSSSLVFSTVTGDIRTINDIVTKTHVSTTPEIFTDKSSTQDLPNMSTYPAKSYETDTSTTEGTLFVGENNTTTTISKSHDAITIAADGQTTNLSSATDKSTFLLPKVTSYFEITDNDNLNTTETSLNNDTISTINLLKATIHAANLYDTVNITGVSTPVSNYKRSSLALTNETIDSTKSYDTVNIVDVSTTEASVVGTTSSLNETNDLKKPYNADNTLNFGSTEGNLTSDKISTISSSNVNTMTAAEPYSSLALINKSIDTTKSYDTGNIADVTTTDANIINISTIALFTNDLKKIYDTGDKMDFSSTEGILTTDKISTIGSSNVNTESAAESYSLLALKNEMNTTTKSHNTVNIKDVSTTKASTISVSTGITDYLNGMDDSKKLHDTGNEMVVSTTEENLTTNEISKTVSLNVTTEDPAKESNNNEDIRTTSFTLVTDKDNETADLMYGTFQMTNIRPTEISLNSDETKTISSSIVYSTVVNSTTKENITSTDVTKDSSMDLRNTLKETFYTTDASSVYNMDKINIEKTTSKISFKAFVTTEASVRNTFSAKVTNIPIEITKNTSNNILLNTAVENTTRIGFSIDNAKRNSFSYNSSSLDFIMMNNKTTPVEKDTIGNETEIFEPLLTKAYNNTKHISHENHILLANSSLEQNITNSSIINNITDYDRVTSLPNNSTVSTLEKINNTKDGVNTDNVTSILTNLTKVHFIDKNSSTPITTTELLKDIMSATIIEKPRIYSSYYTIDNGTTERTTHEIETSVSKNTSESIASTFSTLTKNLNHKLFDKNNNSIRTSNFNEALVTKSTLEKSKSVNETKVFTLVGFSQQSNTTSDMSVQNTTTTNKHVLKSVTNKVNTRTVDIVGLSNLLVNETVQSELSLINTSIHQNVSRKYSTNSTTQSNKNGNSDLLNKSVTNGNIVRNSTIDARKINIFLREKELLNTNVKNLNNMTISSTDNLAVPSFNIKNLETSTDMQTKVKYINSNVTSTPTANILNTDFKSSPENIAEMFLSKDGSIKSLQADDESTANKEATLETIVKSNMNDLFKNKSADTSTDISKSNIGVNNVTNIKPTNTAQFECTKAGRFSETFTDKYYYICVKNNSHFVRYKLHCQSGYHVNRSTIKCETNVLHSTQPTVLPTSLISAFTESPATQLTSNVMIDTPQTVLVTENILNILKKSAISAKRQSPIEQQFEGSNDKSNSSTSNTTVNNENIEELEIDEEETKMLPIFELNIEPISVKPLLLVENSEMENVEIFKNNYNYQVKHDMPIIIGNTELMHPTTDSATEEILNKKKNKSSTSKDLPHSNSSKTNNLNITNMTNTTTHEIDKKILFKCPNKTIGKYAEKSDCRTFYICTGSEVPIVKVCPVGTVFSHFRKQCTENLAHCIRNNEFECSSEGRIRDLLTDTFYYICVKNKNHYTRFKLGCQNGFHVNESTLRCERNFSGNSEQSSVSQDTSDKSTAEKEDDETSTEKHQAKRRDTSFKCEKKGKFSDPENCRKYYVCSERNNRLRKKRKRCKKDKVFHKDKLRCVSAESYECEY